MRKIPTLFRRDPDDLKRVTRDVHPDCAWVLAGEGTPTRKYDGTCVMYDGARWWARREVKPGKLAPADYQPIETDPVTGKTVGWEPIEQTGWLKLLIDVDEHGIKAFDEVVPGTYELIGPKVNGNPEMLSCHILVRHGFTAWADGRHLETLPLDYDALAAWLHAHPTWEGIVWHHPDGRMAKLKRRDFAAPAEER